MTKSAPFRCLRAVALPLLAISLFAAGCGSSSAGKIPAEQKNQINNSVQQAADYYENGKCDEADGKVAEAKTIADELDVDPEIKDGLQQLLSKLDELETTCAPAEVTTTTDSTTTPTTSATSTTESTDSTKSSTSSTTSSSTSSTTSSTTPTNTNTNTTTTPPDGGGVGGDDGGIGGGAPRKTEKHKPGKGPKSGKVPPGQAKKKSDEKKSKTSKKSSGGVTG